MQTNKKDRKYYIERLILIVYAGVLFTLNILRFQNNFWGDECFTIELVPKSLMNIVQITANDVHPPLYYFILKFFVSIFGNTYWIDHFVSLIPFVLVAIFSIVVIHRAYGVISAGIFLTIAGLSENALTYNIQVRMYAWAAFFILMSSYYMGQMLKEETKKNKIFFVFFSLCAAYTHYYALVTVAFLYLFLMGIALFTKRIQVKSVLLIWLVTVLCYLPWLMIFIHSYLARINNYWIKTKIPLMDNLAYFFSSMIIFLVFLVCILYEVIRLLKKQADVQEILWMMAGLFATVCTFLLGMFISAYVTPFYLLRYLYPATIMVWFIFAIMTSHLPGKQMTQLAIIAILLITYIPQYQNMKTKEMEQKQRLDQTLAVTKTMKKKDVIVTNKPHISWSIGAYYYPGHTYLYDANLNKTHLKKGIVYWYIMNEYTKKQNEWMTTLKSQGCQVKTIIIHGNLGTNDVNIYQVVKV